MNKLSNSNRVDRLQLNTIKVQMANPVRVAWGSHYNPITTDDKNLLRAEAT